MTKIVLWPDGGPAYTPPTARTWRTSVLIECCGAGLVCAEWIGAAPAWGRVGAVLLVIGFALLAFGVKARRF